MDDVPIIDFDRIPIIKDAESNGSPDERDPTFDSVGIAMPG